MASEPTQKKTASSSQEAVSGYVRAKKALKEYLANHENECATYVLRCEPQFEDLDEAYKEIKRCLHRPRSGHGITEITRVTDEVLENQYQYHYWCSSEWGYVPLWAKLAPRASTVNYAGVSANLVDCLDNHLDNKGRGVGMLHADLDLWRPVELVHLDWFPSKSEAEEMEATLSKEMSTVYYNGDELNVVEYTYAR